MDLAPVIESFLTGVYTVTKREESALVNGIAQPPSISTRTVRANVQPVTGRDLNRLPEGMRQSEVIAIWSKGELFVQTSDRLPDLFAYKGKSYEVQNCEPWDDNGNYFKALAVKIGDL